MVLESNQGKVEARVAVEEEEQRQIHADIGIGLATDVDIAARGHLAPLDLVHVVEEELGIQTPPGLVVLVDALATNGQLKILNSALSNPVVIGVGIVAGEVEERGTGEGLAARAGSRGQ